MLPTIQGEFRVGTDPELRFSPSGMAICKVRIVASKRRQNQQTQEWEDAATCWLTATGFKQMAENMAESLASGQLVTVTGQLEVQEWEDRDGNKRSSPNVLLTSIGPSLSRDAAMVQRRDQQQGGQQRQQGGQQQGGGEWGQQQANDPWASGSNDEPPF